MRILQINANYGFGSTGLIIKDIDSIISKQADMASYVAFQRTNAIVANGIQIGNNLDWKCHALKCRLFGHQGFYSKSQTTKFLKSLTELQPDIVHLHNLHSNFIHIGLLLKWLRDNNIATIITMHDCWWFTGKCFHYVDIACNNYTIGCGNCPKRKAPPASIFRDCSSEVFRKKKELLLSIPNLTMVGCSDWICNEARKSFLSNSRLERIYNGVDTKIFAPTARNENSTFTVLGMANKWLTIENFGLIDLILTKTNANITIAGCTASQKQKLIPYGERVNAIGFVKDRKEMARIYQNADVFVNMTHADTLPTVNMESECCGTPVITYNSAGSPELVIPGTGFVVEKGNQEAIIEIIKTQNLPNRDKCAKLAHASYNKDYCYQNYIDLYRSVVKE